MEFEDKKDYFAIALLLGLSSLLLWISWSSVPYEQDQMSKAAKVLHMSKGGTYMSPTSGISGYRDKLFSLYYIFSSYFHSASGLGVFLSGNFLSSLFGILSSVLISVFTKRHFGVKKWLSLFILANIPIFIFTFSYSNEMAISFALFLSSLIVLDYNFGYKSFVSGVLFGAACFSRPDASLLIPFWLIWHYMKADDGGGREILKSLAALAVFGFSYSFYILGEIPLDTSTGFKWGGSLKLTAAMMSYPFGLPVLVITLYGAWIILARERMKEGYALLGTLLPAFFYIGNLSSPKYVFHLVLPVAVAAALGLQRMTRPTRYASIAFMLVFWAVSISPFGVKFGSEGAHWYLPTADGAVPTGSYAYFYSKSNDELHRATYIQELDNAEKVAEYVHTQSDTVTLVGGINNHALKYVAVRSGYEGSIPRMNRTLGALKDSSNAVMVRRSYLWGMRMSESVARKFKGWLSNGRVNAISCEKCLFPELIKIGYGVEKGNNYALGKRILFVNNYTEGYSSLKSEGFIKDYRSLDWVKNGMGGPDLENAVYTGSVASAYERDVHGGVVTRMDMPYRYTSFKNPKSVKFGYNDLFSAASKAH